MDGRERRRAGADPRRRKTSNAIYEEPLWRRLPAAANQTRRVTGGSDPEAPGCAASGETHARRKEARTRAIPARARSSANTAGERHRRRPDQRHRHADFTPRLSANGEEVAFGANGRLIAEGNDFNRGTEGNPTDLFVANMRPGLTRDASAHPGDQGRLAAIRGRIRTDQRLRNLPRRRAGRVQHPAHRLHARLADARQRAAARTRDRRTVRRRPRRRHAHAGHARLRRRRRTERAAVHPTSQEDRRPVQGLSANQTELGALSPDFSGDGDELVFTSTAANLVYGDGNSPREPVECCVAGDGSDVFAVNRIQFPSEPPPQSISPAPEPALAAAWRLGVTARSRRRRQRAAVRPDARRRTVHAGARGSVVIESAAAARGAHRVRARHSSSAAPTRGRGEKEDDARDPTQGGRHTHARDPRRTREGGGLKTLTLALARQIRRRSRAGAAGCQRRSPSASPRRDTRLCEKLPVTFLRTSSRLSRASRQAPRAPDRALKRSRSARPQTLLAGRVSADDLAPAPARAFAAGAGAARRAARAFTAASRRRRRSRDLAPGTAFAAAAAAGCAASAGARAAGQDRRHRVLGTARRSAAGQPRPADHARQRRRDHARRVGLRRQRLARDRDRLRRDRTGASPGAGRANSGPSRTGGRARRRSRTAELPPLAKTTRYATSPAARSSPPTRTWRSKRTPTRRCQAPPACRRSRPRRARRTAGSAARRCRNRRSAPFTCTGTAARVEEQPYPNAGIRSRTCARSKTRIFESVAYGKQRSPHRRTDGSARRCCTSPKPAPRCSRCEEELPLYGVRASRPKRSNTCTWLDRRRAVGGGRQAEPGDRRRRRQVTVLRRLDGVWTPGDRPGEARALARIRCPTCSRAGHEQKKRTARRRTANGDARSAARSRPNRAPKTPGSRSARPATANAKPRPAARCSCTSPRRAKCSACRRCRAAAERALPSNAAGAVARLVCPAREDCWMANVSGWLYHLAREGERTLPTSELPGFPEGKLIIERTSARRRDPAGSAATRRRPTPRACRKNRPTTAARSPKRKRRRWSNPRSSCRCSRTCTAA